MIDWEFIKEALRKGKMHKLMDYLSVYGSALVDEHEQLWRELDEMKKQIELQKSAFKRALDAMREEYNKREEMKYCERIATLEAELRELQEKESEVIISPDDPAVELFDDESGIKPIGTILRGSPMLREIVLHILTDWSVVSDNRIKLEAELKAMKEERKQDAKFLEGETANPEICFEDFYDTDE